MLQIVTNLLFSFLGYKSYDLLSDHMLVGKKAIDYYAEAHLTEWNAFTHTLLMPTTMYGMLLWIPALFNLSPKLAKNDNSVIFLWLGGGATHIETFNPIPYAPVERRSATGFVETKIPTVKIGGLFKEIAKRSDKVNIVRSFAHKDSNHQTATHWVVGGERNQGIIRVCYAVVN